MKIILVASLFACGALPSCPGADTGVPAQLAEARARYEAAIADATKPIRDRYLRELEELRVNAFATKDADLAFAVSQEIALLGGVGAAETVGTDPSSAGGIRQRLTNTTWTWYADQTITFLPDGVARWSNSRAGASTFTWKVVGALPPVIEGKAWNGSKYKMTLNAGLRTGKVAEGTLPERPTAQIVFK